MKIAVTVTVCGQIGVDTWQDYHHTKVFGENATIKEIDDWIKQFDKNSSFPDVRISTYEE